VAVAAAAAVIAAEAAAVAATVSGMETRRFGAVRVPDALSATASAFLPCRGTRRLCHTRAVTTTWSFSLSGASRHQTRGSVR